MSNPGSGFRQDAGGVRALRGGSMRSVVRGLALLLLCCVSTALQTGIALAEKRVALIIGNGKYAFGPALPNVRNDADAMGALFKAASFDVVEVRHNLGKASLRAAIRDLSERAANADVLALYYAGHGIEVGQANYLIPVDAHLATDFDVEDETLSLERALQAMAPAKRLRLVILDACRENPFIGGMKRTVATRGVGSGRARAEPSATQPVIAFGPHDPHRPPE